MSRRGGDYSTTRPTVDAMKKAGWRFAARYLRDLDKTNGDKSLTKEEADRLRVGGITIVSNEETTGKQGLTGFDGGIHDATMAHQAHVLCGGPKTRPIYFSPWDHDPAALTSSQISTVFAYLRGVGSVLGVYRVGLYAGRVLLREAFDRQLISWGWEAAGWKNGNPDPRTHIVQHVTASWQVPGTDADEAMKADFGQWDVEGEMMALTDSDVKTLIRLIDHDDASQPGNSFNHQELAKRLNSLDTRLAVLESTVQSGVPINLTDEQLQKFSDLVTTKLATAGFKMSGTMTGAVELGADA